MGLVIQWLELAWKTFYRKELEEGGASDPVTEQTMTTIFRKAKLIAYIGGVVNLALFLVVLPSVMLSFGILSLDQFSGWVMFCQVWVCQ